MKTIKKKYKDGFTYKIVDTEVFHGFCNTVKYKWIGYHYQNQMKGFWLAHRKY
jgi:hypothetical protein